MVVDFACFVLFFVLESQMRWYHVFNYGVFLGWQMGAMIADFFCHPFVLSFLRGGRGRYALWVEGRNGSVTLTEQFNSLNVGICFHLK